MPSPCLLSISAELRAVKDFTHVSTESTGTSDSLNVSRSRLPSLHYFVFISCVIVCCLSLEICACVCPWDCLCLHLSLCHFAFVLVPPVFPPCTPPPPSPPTSLMMDGQLVYFQSAISPDAVRGLDAAAGGRARRGMKGGVGSEEEKKRSEVRTGWCRGHGIWKTSKKKKCDSDDSAATGPKHVLQNQTCTCRRAAVAHTILAVRWKSYHQVLWKLCHYGVR